MKIKFYPTDKECEINSDQSVLDVAKDNGIQIKSVCGGIPSCAECRIQIKEGEYNVLPPSPEEIALIGNAAFVDRSRLSCQLKCFGDVTIDLSEQIDKQESGAFNKKPRGRATVAEGKESVAVEGSILLGGQDLEMFKGKASEQESMKTDELIDEANSTKAILDSLKKKKR